MADGIVITNEAELDRAEARIDQLMNNWKNDEELAELKALAKAANDYVDKEFDELRAEMDGVNHITGLLDVGGAELDDLIAVFGSRERFVEYMTRERNIDVATMDALAAAFHLTREELDKPFLGAPGWDDLLMDGGEACGDVGCCRPGEVDWRGEVGAGVGADGVRGLVGCEGVYGSACWLSG